MSPYWMQFWILNRYNQRALLAQSISHEKSISLDKSHTMAQMFRFTLWWRQESPCPSDSGFQYHRREKLPNLKVHDKNLAQAPITGFLPEGDKLRDFTESKSLCEIAQCSSYTHQTQPSFPVRSILPCRIDVNLVPKGRTTNCTDYIRPKGFLTFFHQDFGTLRITGIKQRTREDFRIYEQGLNIYQESRILVWKSYWEMENRNLWYTPA